MLFVKYNFNFDIKSKTSNLTTYTIYQRYYSYLNPGSILDQIIDICTHGSKGLYCFMLSDPSNYTDLPDDVANCSVLVTSSNNSIQVYICLRNSYQIYFNASNYNNWCGWKKVNTILPTSRTIITGNSNYYTIEQDQHYVESYYYRRYGLLFVNLNVKCVTPQTNNTNICTLPTMSQFTTITTCLTSEDNSVLHIIFQGSYIYVKGGQVGKLYTGSFCYPIS